MKWSVRMSLALATVATLFAVAGAPTAGGQEKEPNIVFIMGDDVGWLNIGAYHQGLMAGRTPNLDKMAAEGMRFTDYYAEASCTAGRANFITGEIPIRTGMTTVGQAGAEKHCCPSQDCVSARTAGCNLPIYSARSTRES